MITLLQCEPLEKSDTMNLCWKLTTVCARDRDKRKEKISGLISLSMMVTIPGTHGSKISNYQITLICLKHRTCLNYWHTQQKQNNIDVSGLG